ncbi:MAG TPA: glycosyltransferase family 2 protein [Candidatus Saccharimonadales bacterium]|nr:glycosyltransferase family 2 protein [Candidatus Saccharimonadales bacterium]
MKNIFVSIIIANFNGEKYLSTCLSSVCKTTYTNFEILIVDDGSTDRSEKIIIDFQKKDKRIHLQKNDINTGAAASRNKAAAVAKGEILIFLDNDTEVDANWLSHMLEIFRRDASIGGCQALLVDFEKRNQIQTAGTKLWAMTGWALPIGQNDAPQSVTKETDIIALSAALAVRKTIFEKIGGFDELESVVTEDLDFSWRVWLAGYRIVLSPKSIVYHWTKSVDMRKNMQHSKEIIYFHLTKNSLMSILKNYELYNAIKFSITSLFISLGRSIVVLIKRKDISAWKGTMRGLFWILSHFSLILEKRKLIQKIRNYSDAVLFSTVIQRLSLRSVYTDYFQQTNLI